MKERLKNRLKNRIFAAIVKGGMIHTIGMFAIWYLCFKDDSTRPFMAFNWYVTLPVFLYNIVLIVSGFFYRLQVKGKVSDPLYEQIMALLFTGMCCVNYVLIRKFELSFLVLVLPLIMRLLKQRKVRNLPHAIALIIFYGAMQYLPDLLPGEPWVYISREADTIFGAYISLCIMIFLRETRDAYEVTFRKKEESELRLKTYSDFLFKKNRDVREAVHNVKGTGEMVLRYNASDTSAGHVMAIMEACDRIVEKVDRILETSRVELFKRNRTIKEHSREEVPDAANDGTYLYAPGAYILVADDSVEALNLVRALLARTGMRIDTVLTGTEALKMISYNYYNLIVLDNVFPDMSAVQVMHSIKEGNGVNANTPVVVCTTGDRDDVRDMYIGEGFAEVASKPLSGEQIERITERYLPARLVSRREVEG